jgi:hypothetical protein
MPVSFSNLPANNPSLKGQLAARKQFFDGYRYAVAPIHTRFDELVWFVWDANVLDETGRAEVVRQEATLEEALRGL